MNRTAMHVTVILITGIVIGLIARSRRIEREQIQAAEAKRAADAALAERSQPASDKAEAIVVQGDGWLSEFELTERSGKTVSSQDLLGQPYVVSFFFTTCPSTCPMQNEKLKILQEEFYGEGVRFLSVSCDPEVDTPEVLSEYAKRFEADENQWLFLTGDLNYIRRVGAEVFRLPVNRRFHTDRFVLVDGQGEIAAIYEWPEPEQFDRLKQDIRKLLSGETLSEATPSEQES
ncbi:MAG: SCO family protein [Pirellulaceae bacterium]